MSLDLAPALRDAIMAIPAVVAEIDEWKGEPAVFTRRPIPADAPAKIILINPDTSITDADGLTSSRPIVVRDILLIGQKGRPGDAGDHTRAIERAAYALREHFHRTKFTVNPEGFSVIDIRATGPVPAPVDDDSDIARLVSLTIRLRKD